MSLFMRATPCRTITNDAIAMSESIASFAIPAHATLSQEQSCLFEQMMCFVCAHITAGQAAVAVIEGEAGTGKSAFLQHLFVALQRTARGAMPHCLRGTRNVLLVNHAEMIKAYHHAAESVPCVAKKDYLRPTSFINRMEKSGQRVDIALVDEAHLLLTRADPYNRFRHANQLQEILKYARVVVIVFDRWQVLKFKSFWRDDGLAAILAGRIWQRFQLKQQLRMAAPQRILKWLTMLRQGHLAPLPPSSAAFELSVYDDARAMYHYICECNRQFGRSRMLATYDYPYRLDGKDHFIRTGNLTLRWDRSKPRAKRPWAERNETIDEVGSVYTVQGFDLEYVGLIIGPSFDWDQQRQRLIVLPHCHEDDGAMHGKACFGADALVLTQELMRNALSVLMTRAVRGLCLYAHNPKLRQRLCQCQQRGRLGCSD